MTGGGIALLAAALFLMATPAVAAASTHPKLDRTLNERANAGRGKSRVIVVLNAPLAGAEVKKLGGKAGRRLDLIGAQVMEIPNVALTKLADLPAVASVHHDRPFAATMNRVAVTTGARGVQQVLGLTGAGVGVAVVDSGITSWHDDLQYTGGSPLVKTTGGQRVAAFVDFVNGSPTPYDDHGHGTHVAGIIAGNGYDSRGIRAGMAPDAHIVSLKVLDGTGKGVISNLIAALGYAVANKSAYNIRVINLSVGAPITESYRTDPLTLAAKQAVDAGIVVVSAAGNLGKNAAGATQYGGITAPGNAPWVLTVGAYSHQGTVTRVDDVMASYSSRGPTAIDFQAKPDLVAPGTGIASLASRDSFLYTAKAAYLLKGTVDPGYKPYLSLSGTSMAAPVVSGTVALMIQANPNLTPNLVKAILQYTAQEYSGYNALTEGAGFVNSRGAADLARYFGGAVAGQRFPSARMWSHHLIWGNRRLGGGAISRTANAWDLSTVWGAALDEDGDNIVWGTACETEDCDDIVWGTTLDDGLPVPDVVDEDGDNIVWGTSCPINPETGLEDCDNIVWGTDVDDNVVWGPDCGGEDCDNIVWGTACQINPETGLEDCDNIVWGTSLEDGSAVLWETNCTINPETGQEDCDNIVWGTSADGEDLVWGATAVDDLLFEDPELPPTDYDSLSWDVVIGDSALDTTSSTTDGSTSTGTTTTTTTTTSDTTTTVSDTTTTTTSGTTSQTTSGTSLVGGQP